jgi:OOP family OmpA-OmpF porin
MDHLVKKEGISKDELTAKGWGIEKPIADNNTPEGRETNRRVEFLVTEAEVTSKKVEIDPKTGKEQVLEEKKDTVHTDTGTPTNPGPEKKPGKKPAAKPAEKK